MSDVSSEALKSRGFTEPEIEKVLKWVADGKPGLAKARAEKLGEVYILGYSCQDISKMFPEYPEEILLWARGYYDWDGLRDKYRSVVQKELTHAAVSVRMEGLRFLADVMRATHMKWRKQLMDYISDPEKFDPPDFLPKTLSQYAQLGVMLDQMILPPAKGKELAKSGEVPAPLVSINVTHKAGGGSEVLIGETRQEDVRKALLEDMGEGDGGEDK